MRRSTLVSAAAIAVIAVPTLGHAPGFAQDATPAAAYSCDDVEMAGVTGTSRAMPHDMAMGGTPMTEMDHSMMELDQMYIDMMIPHHASIIAMAEAALPRLEDERLREMAQTVIATQQPEIDELRAMRERLYGAPDPMPMDDNMMGAMSGMMPGMAGTMDEMAFQMDAAAQVAAICAATDADLAFIDLTIPHHRMAVEASEAVIAQEGDPDVRALAQRVIEAQEREIQVLGDIREELFGSATPEPVGS